MASVRYTHLPAPVVSLPVEGQGERFPVRRVYCVGRNYADHALEMGVDPRSEAPFFFCKPTDTVLCAEHDQDVLEIAYPPRTENLHHEVELVIAIGRGGRDIQVDKAHEHIFGQAIGIDLTRRDLQLAMRKSGKPWEIGKTFEQCAPIGPLHAAAQGPKVGTDASIMLKVNGVPRQHSNLGKLIWSVPEIVADLSRYFTLQTGDIIFTGTPEGVGPLLPGDEVNATIDGLGSLSLRILPAEEAAL